MSSKRYIAILKNAGGIVNKAAPIAYSTYADALAAAVADGPAGGYEIVDAWKMGYVLLNTTGVYIGGLTDQTVNCNTAKNYAGVASELFP